LDSLSSGHPAGDFSTIRKYIETEAAKKKGRKADLEKYKDFNVKVRTVVIAIESHDAIKMQVPQQPNGSDCGFYTMHFAKVFMEDPEKCRDMIWV